MQRRIQSRKHLKIINFGHLACNLSVAIVAVRDSRSPGWWGEMLHHPMSGKTASLRELSLRSGVTVAT